MIEISLLNLCMSLRSTPFLFITFSRRKNTGRKIEEKKPPTKQNKNKNQLAKESKKEC
jgi:hypothetical protein